MQEKTGQVLVRLLVVVSSSQSFTPSSRQMTENEPPTRQIESLPTLIDQAEAACHIDIRKKTGAKPSG